jgi:hypothetical protein
MLNRAGASGSRQERERHRHAQGESDQPKQYAAHAPHLRSPRGQTGQR